MLARRPPLTEHLLARHERRAALLTGGGSHGPDGCWPVVIRPASSPYSARSSGLNTSRGAALQLQSDWCASGRAGALQWRPLSRRAVPRSRARRISACGRNDAGVPVCRCRMRCASAPGPADSKLCVERARGGRGECEPAPLAAWCRGALPTARRLSRAAGYPFLCVGGGALGAHSVRGVCVRVPLARCCWMQRFPVVVCWAARRSVFGLLKRKRRNQKSAA